LEFGNGDFSYNPEVTYTYNKEGEYQLTLTAYNNCSSDTSVRWITICKLPLSAFDHEMDGLTVYFYNSSSDADSCQWFYGDGIGSFDWNPIHTYQLGGDYEVTLMTWNNCGADTLIQNLISVSVNDIRSGDMCSIFPNPSKGWIQIYLNERLKYPIQCNLYYMNSGLVFQKQISSLQPDRIIRVVGLNAGCYMLTIISQDKITTRKIIIY
jgi:hypothetical protein